ncbi:MAG: hypothetical protein V3T83_16755, partial [Acidobacteriota bacterium]
MAPDTDWGSPYVGPLPFQRQDRHLFFGRVREVNALASLIFAHRCLLLYAESGAGKSSLLNAGLVPRLEEEKLEVLPLARVRGDVPEGVQPANIYAYNTLASWQAAAVGQGGEEASDQPAGPGLTLAEFLEGRFGRPQDKELPPLRVAIFDQFEELFTFYPERWQDRSAFFGQVKQALEADPLLRILFVMREDYIARLDPYLEFLPERLRTRLRLERLRRESALKAVTGPLKGTGRSFGEGVAEALVEDLIKIRVEAGSRGTLEVPGEVVEPVQLQVVCQTLWHGLPTDAPVITRRHLESYGDPVEALSAFYERSVQQTIGKTGIGEGELRRWFEKVLITPAGTRGTVHRGGARTGGIPNQAIDELEDAHLIRAEWRSGGRWYELNHDRFIEPVKKSNQAWVAERGPAEQLRQRLEEQAAQWAAAGRAESDLLSQGELPEAERWQDSPEASELGINETVLALIQASRTSADAKERARKLEVEHAKAFAHAQARANKRLRRAFLAVAAVSLLAIAAAVVAYFQAEKALENEEIAKAEQLKANQAEVQANEAAAKYAIAVGDLAEAKKFEDRAKAANQQIQSLQQSSDLTSGTLAEVTKGRDNLQAELTASELEQDNLRSDLQKVESERDGLRTNLQDVEGERDGFKTGRQKAESERDDLRAKLRRAESEKQAALSELEELKKIPALSPVQLADGVQLEFVTIQPGEFQMGSKKGENDEK